MCVATLVLLPAWLACGGGAPDVRYPRRPEGCAVKSYPGAAAVPVDELGNVRVECGGDVAGCERKLLDAVCARGGDVAWGRADDALTATSLTAHAAHTRKATQGPRARGCDVKVFQDSPPWPTENIGPVTALCDPDDKPDACQRELQDQVCTLGGDVLWQMDGPTPVDTQNGPRQRMTGRAAHTK